MCACTRPNKLAKKERKITKVAPMREITVDESENETTVAMERFTISARRVQVMYLDELELGNAVVRCVVVLAFGDGILIVHRRFGSTLAPRSGVCRHLLGAHAAP